MENRELLINTGKSKLWVVNNFTEDYFDQLITLPLNVEPPIKIRGIDLKQRRNVAFFSDSSAGYNYSTQVMNATPLSDYPLLVNLTNKVNNLLGTNFNGVLVNCYVDGSKYLSAHSDDEKALDKTKRMVAGLSYGEPRKFRIRNKQDNKIVMDVNTLPCSLLVMEGNFQSDFKHEIPKQLKIKEPRISLTFRHHTQ